MGVGEGKAVESLFHNGGGVKIKSREKRDTEQKAKKGKQLQQPLSPKQQRENEVPRVPSG